MFTPTRREVLLIIILLLVLLSLSRVHVDHGRLRFEGPSYAVENSPTQSHSVYPQSFRSKVSFAEAPVPETKVIAHVPGWTIFDNMYILNGTIYLVSDHPSTLPDKERMTSTSARIETGLVAESSRLPTDNEMRFIGTSEAKLLFGRGPSVIPGVTFLVNDHPQFITHYYHWSAELWFGFWRTYSSLDPFISLGNTTLPQPRRLLFTHLDADHWRDYASMNEWVVRSSFPSLTAEFSHDWVDRAKIGHPFVFDRVVFADRSAAMLGYNYLRTQRTASEPFALPGSVDWWSTIRSNVIEFSGLDGSWPAHRPVITYISRQGWGRRMLIQKDHETLVEELYRLRDKYGYEVNVVSMDKLTRIQQLHLAARTTIMMGVHGNGLTSLIWMEPSPRSTVIEFFSPGGFAHDYEYTTRALGMVHYGFWNSSQASSFTSPDVPLPAYPEDFQSNYIPIDGQAVARLCHSRISLSDEADD